MKKSTMNHVAMYQTVLSYIREHESEWNAIPKFVETVGQMEYLLDRLQNNFGFQAVKSLGVSENKLIFRNDLLNLVEVMKKALALYGKSTGNVALRERHKEGRYRYQRLPDQKLELLCAVLLSDLDEFGSELVPYGISAALIQELTDKVSLLQETNFSTRKAIVDRSIATQQIDFFEKKINELLREELDALIVPFKNSNSDFYNVYKKTRKVINKSGGRPIRPAERDDGAAA